MLSLSNIFEWIFRLALIVVLILVSLMVLMSILTHFWNVASKSEHYSSLGDLRESKAVHEARLAQDAKVIKSRIWTEYLRYLKTGERINPARAKEMWLKDSAEYKSDLDFGRFSVVSWNVNVWRFGTQAQILDTLNILTSANVLCLQEYAPNPIYDALLKTHFPYKTIHMITLPSGVQIFGNAIFSKLPLSGIKVIQLRDIDNIDASSSDDGGYIYEQRVAISAFIDSPNLEDKIGIKKLQIINTHLTVGDSDTDALRLEEAFKLVALVDGVSAILCGDFNSGIDNNEKVHTLLETKFKHMYEENSRLYSSTSMYGGTIDNFYYKLPDTVKTNANIVFSPASDHYPVLFSVKNK